jgi:hypothetical protein
MAAITVTQQCCQQTMITNMTHYKIDQIQIIPMKDMSSPSGSRAATALQNNPTSVFSHKLQALHETAACMPPASVGSCKCYSPSTATKYTTLLDHNVPSVL